VFVPTPPEIDFLSPSQLPGGAPVNTRRTTYALTDGGTLGTSTGYQDVAFRCGFTFPVTPTRCRVKIRNSDLLANTTTSQSMVITGIWWGTPNVGSETAWAGDFTGAPTKVDNGTTQDLATEYVTSWFTPPNTAVAYALQGLSIGITSSVDSKMNFSSSPGWTWHGATGAGCAAAAGNAAAPAGTGTASPYLSVLDIRLEYEFVGDNQIGFFVGTSITSGWIGTSGTAFGHMGPDNTWPHIAALRLGHHAINGGVGGATAANFTSTSALAWTRFDLGANVNSGVSCVPDYAVIDLGVNDCFAGPVGFGAATTLCPDLATFQANIQTIIANLQTAGITRIYICTQPPGVNVPPFAATCYQAGSLGTAVAAGALGTVNLTDSATSQAGPGGGNPGLGSYWFAAAMQTTVANCTAASSTTVTTTANFTTANISPGALIRGTGVTDGTYVKSVNSATNLTASASINTGGAVTLTFTYSSVSFEFPASGIAEGPFPVTAQSGTGPLALTAHGTTAHQHLQTTPVTTLSEWWRQQYNFWIRSGPPGTLAVLDFDFLATAGGPSVLGGQAVPYTTQNWLYYSSTSNIHPSHPGMFHRFAKDFTATLAGV
jgi:hypothetical protein